MTRARLFDLLRRATDLSAGQRLILAGSQAFYSVATGAPHLVQRSEEADVLLVGVERSLVLKLEEALGMESFTILLARLEAFRASVFANTLPDRLAKLARHLRDWKREDLARAFHPPSQS